MAEGLSLRVDTLNCGRQAACRVAFGTSGQVGLLLVEFSASKLSQSHASATLAAGSGVGQEAPPVCGGVSNCAWASPADANAFSAASVAAKRRDT